MTLQLSRVTGQTSAPPSVTDRRAHRTHVPLHRRPQSRRPLSQVCPGDSAGWGQEPVRARSPRHAASRAHTQPVRNVPEVPGRIPSGLALHVAPVMGPLGPWPPRSSSRVTNPTGPGWGVSNRLTQEATSLFLSLVSGSEVTRGL